MAGAPERKNDTGLPARLFLIISFMALHIILVRHDARTARAPTADEQRLAPNVTLDVCEVKSPDDYVHIEVPAADLDLKASAVIARHFATHGIEPWPENTYDLYVGTKAGRRAFLIE
jgi:hypothetical protein